VVSFSLLAAPPATSVRSTEKPISVTTIQPIELELPDAPITYTVGRDRRNGNLKRFVLDNGQALRVALVLPLISRTRPNRSPRESHARLGSQMEEEEAS
jgi:hypothetical protein